MSIDAFHSVLASVRNVSAFDIYLAVYCSGPNRIGYYMDSELREELRDLIIEYGPDTFRAALEDLILANAAGGRSRTVRQERFESLELPWYPALLRIAIDLRQADRFAFDDGQGLDLLEMTRNALPNAYYAVVEEQSDDLLGLNLFPWPRVDRSGRLCFPIDTDPIPVEAPRPSIQHWIDTHRAHWSDAGLSDSQLDSIRLDYGHAFAVWSTTTDDFYPWPLDATLPVAAASDLGYVVDISWDARNLSKIAHLTASHGAATPRDFELQREEFDSAADQRSQVIEVGGTQRAEQLGLQDPDDDFLEGEQLS